MAAEPVSDVIRDMPGSIALCPHCGHAMAAESAAVDAAANLRERYPRFASEVDAWRARQRAELVMLFGERDVALYFDRPADGR